VLQLNFYRKKFNADRWILNIQIKKFYPPVEKAFERSQHPVCSVVSFSPFKKIPGKNAQDLVDFKLGNFAYPNVSRCFKQEFKVSPVILKVLYAVQPFDVVQSDSHKVKKHNIMLRPFFLRFSRSVFGWHLPFSFLRLLFVV